ncbi:MAG: exopolyphosphatase, partial [Rhodospirillales bacterium]|nr:exopolyphosphatase [Rhodospirillales bacterium]
MAEEKTYNLITRPDFDGVVCAVLLREVGLIKPSKVHFAQPWNVQNGKVAISGDDVTANLPYVPDVHMCFDHHGSELERVGAKDNMINNPKAPSAARVVYEYYGGAARFSNVSTEMMDAVDQADSANYGIEDILAPSDWTLLNFLMDPRTGLERAADLPTTHEEFMQDLVVYCQNPDVREILDLP